MSLSKGMESINRTPQRIKEEGLRILDIVKDYDLEKMKPSDRNFLEGTLRRLEQVKYTENFFISERQVTWLRDIKDRYL